MSKRAYIAVLAFLSLALFPYAIATYNNMGEDAFISFRYVRNLVQGKGLVFNEGEWVEGYSNFSWVLMLAVAAKMGGDILLWSKLLGVASMAGMVWLAGLFYLGRKSGDGDDGDGRINPVHLFAPLAIFFNPQLHYHVGRGLETNFYALVFLACLFALARARWLAASLCLALLAMSRPEGVLHFAGFALVMGIVFISLGSIRRVVAVPDTLSWKSMTWLVAPGVVVLAFFIGWRLATYGQFFPNTVYAKTAPLKFLQNPSIEFILLFVKSWNGLPLLAIVALIFFWKRIDQPWRLAMAGLGALAVLAYVVLVGEVQAEVFRHFIPLIAPVILVIQSALLALGRSRIKLERQAAWAAFAVLLALNFYTSSNGDHPASRLHARTAQFLLRWDWAARWEWYRHPPIHMFSEAGRWAEGHLPPGSLLAGDQMGQMGYYAASHSIVDMLGLMDRHIAHHGLSWEYMASRDPDYFVVFGVGGQPYLGNIREFTELGEFRAIYAMDVILTSRYPEKIDLQFLVYSRRKADDPGKSPDVIAVGATADEWEKYWRF